MHIYTYSEARQNLAELLNQAAYEGEALIKRKDGQLFAVQPINESSSPFDIKRIKTNLSSKDIIQFIRKSRKRAGKI